MATRIRHFVPALLLAAISSAGLHGQENPLVPDHAGSWAAAPDVRVGALPADTRASALALATRLLDIVRRMPAMAPSAGFQVVPHTFVSLENIDRSDNSRLPKFAIVQVTAALVPYERTSRGAVPNERDTAGSVTILVNSLEHTGTQPMGTSDDQGAFIQDPDEPAETQHGFPVYQDGNLDKWLLMRRRNAPVVVPITRERYLQAALRDAQTELARVQARRAAVPAGVPAGIIGTIDEAITQQKTRVANLQRTLTGMSAADRRKPAILGSPNDDDPVVFVGPGEGTVFVGLNPALLDSALPPATPQTLSIRVSSNDDLFPGLGAKLDQQLDWAALSQILK